jgi:hypothetical protein
MRRWSPVLGAALLLIVYLLTLAPALTWAHYGADGGDLARAVATGSIPHPPGFPTYLLLGELFIRLPLKNPAWRLNLMSAVLAASAATLTMTATPNPNPKPKTPNSKPQTLNSQLETPNSKLQTRNPKPQTPNSKPQTRNPQLTTCLCLGLAPLFWSQALITEVYAPAAFFAALVMALALRGGPAWALGLAWGLGMGAHPTLLFLAPLVVWSNRKKPGFCRKTWFLIQTGSLALLGWGLMYGPVLLMRGDVPSPWADVSTFDGWWALISGRLYRGYLFALPGAAWPQRLLAWAGLLARQFTPLGALLAGLGWLDLWRERRMLAGASLLSFGAFSLYAIGYNTVDSLVYLVAALPLAALWLSAGLARAGAWLEERWRHSAWLLLLLPLLQALLFWGPMDVSQDRAAMDWAERELEEAPSRAALITAQDAHTFTLWYAQDVLGSRPDVAVIDQDLWGHGPYRKMLAARFAGINAGAPSAVEAARDTGRPVVAVTD